MATPRSPRRSGARGPAAAGALLALALGAGTCDRPPPAEESAELVLGVGSTHEQQVLAALSMVALDRTGTAVDLAPDLGSTVDLRRAATSGEVDLWWDYTGAAWALGLGEQGPPADPVESFERVREADAERGFTWLAPTAANATLALFVRAADLVGEQATLSWLAGELSGGRGALCADPDFLARPAGYAALAQVYSIQVDRVPQVGLGELKAIASTAAGSCFAALATATSGEAAAAGLAPVADDQRLFPAFIAAPVAAATLSDVPEVARALEDLAARLGTDVLRDLNARVVAGEDPRAVAEAFLADLVPPEAPPGRGTTSPTAAPAPSAVTGGRS